MEQFSRGRVVVVVADDGTSLLNPVGQRERERERERDHRCTFPACNGSIEDGEVAKASREGVLKQRHHKKANGH